MPLKAARYIHYRYEYKLFPFKGFTAKITPHTINIDDAAFPTDKVELQVTFCSKKDMWCKKKGRIACDESPVYIIPVTDLPRRLAQFRTHVQGWEFPTEKYDQRVESNDFAWVWKYFL